MAPRQSRWLYLVFDSPAATPSALPRSCYAVPRQASPPKGPRMSDLAKTVGFFIGIILANLLWLAVVVAVIVGVLSLLGVL